MLKVGIRELRKNLKKFLAEETEVLKNGVPVAKITPLEVTFKKLKQAIESPSPGGLEPVVETVEPVSHLEVKPPQTAEFHLDKRWGIRVCPHYNESGQCPEGCVDKEGE